MAIVVSCENDLQEVDNIYSKDEMYQEAVRDVEIFYSDSADVKVKIISPLMINHTRLENLRKEFPEGLEVWFYEKNRLTSKLHANYAVRYDRKYRIEASDSVVVFNEQNQRMVTERLVWDERKKTITSDTLVCIYTEDEELCGYGFKANQDFTKWSLNNTKGSFYADDFTGETTPLTPGANSSSYQSNRPKLSRPGQ